MENATESSLANAKIFHEAERDEWLSSRTQARDSQIQVAQELGPLEDSLVSENTGSDIVDIEADLESEEAELETPEMDEWEHC